MSDAPIRALALETTSRLAQTALVEDGCVIASDAFSTGLKHTAHLVPMIDALCRSRRWRPGEITEIYVSIGPGAFTGTRIGVTLAKTLAFATGAGLVALPTPRVLVENAPPEATDLLVVIDARRGKVWVQRFSRARDTWQAARPELTDLASALAASPRPIWLIGEGVAYHTEAIDPGDRAIHVAGDHQPRAWIVAGLGWQEARAGHFTDPFALRPVYVRRPEAEEKRLGIA